MNVQEHHIDNATLDWLCAKELYSDFRKRQLLRAVRAFRKLVHAHRQWFIDAERFAESDRMFDCGEFGGGSLTDMQIERRRKCLANYVGAVFGFSGDEVLHAEMLQDMLEHEHAILALTKRAKS